MKIKKVVEKVVEPWPIHTLDIGVLVTPSKGLLADDSVDRVELRNIRIISIMTVLTRKLCINAIFLISKYKLYLCDLKNVDSLLPGVWFRKIL